ncbi:ANTAR domain-containing protein [Streptomyces sp. KL116D]|uniref:ANTAR domain-containing protein n=1 Tax=Streptomyces sp. KL116D TaxID=3045152 RepID=UPI003558D738
MPTPDDVPAGETARIADLETEVAHLQTAMQSRAHVDQAIGVISAVGRRQPAEAWDVLREVSMRTNIKLHSVAEQLVACAWSGVLAEPIRAELDRQLMLRQAQDAAEGGYTAS